MSENVSVVSIELERLELGAFTPRLSFDEGWIKELAEDVRRNGQLKPIIARPHPSKPGIYQVIDGEHRVRALRLLGWKSVRAEVRQLSDADAAFLAMRVNELHGKRLSELEEGAHLLRLSLEYGLSQEDLAERFGRSRQWVSDRIRVAKSAHEEVLKSYRNGKIAISHAREIVELPKEVQPEVVKKVADEGLSARQTALLAYALKKAGSEEEAKRILQEPVKALAESYEREPEKFAEAALSEKEEVLETFVCPGCGRKAVVDWVEKTLRWAEK